MSTGGEPVAKWVYQGVWGVLTRWFRVPDRPPALPTPSGEAAHSFRPARGFLNYLKFQFWAAFLVIDGMLVSFWIGITLALPLLGIVLAPFVLLLVVVPDVVAYIAIHLRYDTTWYVMTRRSLRIRRGIWVIHETTITFENVQNVTVSQGPLQRLFGIADVLVHTAGGGDAQAGGQAGAIGPHRGLIEGVGEAERIRDRLLGHLRESRSAGLGDEEEGREGTARPAWTEAHLAVLREIRNGLQA